MIQNLVVLGGGSAGFIAALTLKRFLPQLRVRVIRSPDIGVIGVGEGTTQLFPRFLFEQLRLKPGQFYAETEPTWKLGIRFLWGPRAHFHYSFTNSLDSRLTSLPRNKGFYCDDEFANLDVWYALMEADKALPRGADGRPFFDGHAHLAFHIENKKLVSYLEARCRDFGVEITDATVRGVEKGGAGLAALLLESGERVTADLFVDASGFRAELLGRALEVPFKSYDDALFCDRAVIAGWERSDEPIKPYTTAETMDAGWCWQIEHEHFLNRGYVYSSRFLPDDEAREELLRKNPKITTEPRVVKFRSGRYERMWEGNVVGIGNASGFVEPLEASALQVIIVQCRALAEMLLDSEIDPGPKVTGLYNRFIGATWDEVRDFLAIHYRFNTRLETPFWQTCRGEIALGGAGPVVDFFAENGPSALGRSVLLSPNNPYGLEGYMALLVGQAVPFRKKHKPTDAERKLWRAHLTEQIAAAKRGFDVQTGLTLIRRPGWTWN